MEKKNNECKNFIKAGKMIAKIRICTVRDTNEAPQKPKRLTTNNTIKKEYPVFRYGLCKYKVRVQKNNNTEQSTCCGKVVDSKYTESFFAKKYQR